MSEIIIVSASTRKGETSAEVERKEAIRRFIDRARGRFQIIVDAEKDLRSNMMADLTFEKVDQWPAKIRQEREADGRPCLTVNRLKQPLQQIKNEIAQANLMGQVLPVDGGSDRKTAEYMQGLVRRVENNSQAQVAYTTAADFQVGIGRGYWRIRNDYESSRLPAELVPAAQSDPEVLAAAEKASVTAEALWAQDAYIETEKNPFAIYCDPAARQPDRSDRKFAFKIEDVPMETYWATYGTADGRQIDVENPERESGSISHGLTEFWTEGNKMAPEWFPSGKVRIAEYYYVESTPIQIALIPGKPVLATPQNPHPPTPPNVTMLLPNVPEGVKILARRTVQHDVVKWCKIDGTRILEGVNEAGEDVEDGTAIAGRDVPCDWIPIVEAVGEELNINGKMDMRGVTREAKDACRMSNYWKSKISEAIALAPLAPFVAEVGQVENFSEWAQANTRLFGVLRYKGKSIDGNLVPAPQRNSIEPPIQAMVYASQQTENDIRALTGYIDAQEQERHPEISGKAILARENQAQHGNSHYLDHMGRAVVFSTKCVISMIQRLYDVPRVRRVLGPDDQPIDIITHAGADQAGDAHGLAQGNAAIKAIFDVQTSRFDVVLQVGPSSATRRQAGLDAMLQLVSKVPTLFPIIGDLVVDDMDWPGAQRIAARLKKALAPGLQDTPAGQQPIPPAVQQQMDMLLKQHEALVSQLKHATDLINSKKLDLASKEYIAGLQAQVQLVTTLGKLESQAAIEGIRHEYDRITSMLEMHQTQLNSERDAAVDPDAAPPQGPEGEAGAGNPPVPGGGPAEPSAPVAAGSAGGA